MRKLSVFMSMVFIILFNSNVFALDDKIFSDNEQLRKLVLVINEYSIPTNTKEIITLKGIDFKGDIKNKLIDLCIKENTRKSNSLGERYCEKDKTGKIDLGDFTFGNLKGMVQANIGDNGELLLYQQRTTDAPKQLFELAELLTNKYGKPYSVNLEPIRDENHKKQISQLFYWKDSNGTIIGIDTIKIASFAGITLYYGDVTIMSQSVVNIVSKYIAGAVQEIEKKKSETQNNL